MGGARLDANLLLNHTKLDLKPVFNEKVLNLITKEIMGDNSLLLTIQSSFQSLGIAMKPQHVMQGNPNLLTNSLESLDFNEELCKWRLAHGKDISSLGSNYGEQTNRPC